MGVGEEKITISDDAEERFVRGGAKKMDIERKSKT